MKTHTHTSPYKLGNLSCSLGGKRVVNVLNASGTVDARERLFLKVWQLISIFTWGSFYISGINWLNCSNYSERTAKPSGGGKERIKAGGRYQTAAIKTAPPQRTHKCVCVCVCVCVFHSGFYLEHFHKGVHVYV